VPDYRRNQVPGGTFFFTVNLLDRRSELLVTQIQALRDAVWQVRRHTLFHIDAWVVLPDHMPACGPYRQAMPTSRSLARDPDGILEGFARP
jgi:REP element-mobilizing transposase RayT